jgi:RNA polymerase sigma factor (sigma-70 family)
MASLTHDLRHVLAVAFRRPDADGDLLARFTRTRDEAAFAEIVRRHGPAVLRVCRSLVPHADADDAFQATFFVLARRAESLAGVASLGGWLVGVAGRVARQLRRQGWRRAEVERAFRPIEAKAATPVELDEELTRLPERFRDPVVLCYLEAKSQEVAAAELGQSVRTLRRRLEKAKHVLRLRLERRGVVPAAVAAAPLIITPDVAARTAATAVQFLTGGVRTPAAALAKGIAMTSILKLKVAAGLCAVLGALTVSGVAQDPPKVAPTPSATFPPVVENKRDPVTGTYQNLYTGVTEPRDRDPSQMKSGWMITDDGFPCLITAPNATVARIIQREAKYQYEALSKQWFGTAEKPDFSLNVQVTTAGASDSYSSMRFNDDYSRLKDARVTLAGPLEPMLCNMLPCELAHVVLAARFGEKMPRWAGDGIALTATSPEHQAGADTALRQFLTAGKAIRLKVLFGMARPVEGEVSLVGVPPVQKTASKEDWAVFVTQSTSVVRFLQANAPRKEFPVISRTPYINRLFTTKADGSEGLIRFIQVGLKDGWDTASFNVYGVGTVDQLEDMWLQWLKTDESRAGLPKIQVVQPPPVRPDPTRIPPANVGK